MNKELGYVRVGALIPELKVGNTVYNSKTIIENIKKMEKEGVNIVVTPELSITGYTCADLFFQDVLLNDALEGLKKILEETKNLKIVSIIGIPLKCDNQLFNTAVVINKGKILGIVPKTYIPNYNEFYEKRWFKTSHSLISKTIKLFGHEVPIGVDLLFRDSSNNDMTFGIEICEDLWSPKAPSTDAALAGATMIFNLSASNEIIGKKEYRRNLISNQSAKSVCAYIYASSGVNESSTDLVFGGYAGIYENGSLLKENERFNFESSYIYEDVDIQRISNNRIKDISYMGVMPDIDYRIIDIDIEENDKELIRNYDIYPFVPKDNNKREERCKEIITIQSCGLAKRLKHTNIKKCVIGVSGGLDSTLAFLVIIDAYKRLGISNDNLIAITMPGFGTTGRTYQNAINLMKSYNVTWKEISIKEASLQHFKDIGISESDRSVTYENTQARERTQILMDIANKEGALVIGTGDLSELALGWCTYNGDHMSMYAVNTSIPKTLVRYLVNYYADVETNEAAKKTIKDILDTPVSPELLPPDSNGNIKQQTESVIGPYILHDFFLYHFLRYGASPKKIKYIATKTFKGMYSEEIVDKWLKVFIKRFFSQQFKRSCLPDGPKVGTISVSPRGDLRMPSDADNTIWLD
jgi:NAD+ synthase (glutamine-hydrolysing)